MLLDAVVRGFRDRDILVLGDVLLDEYLSGDCSRISPEAPVPILAVSSTRHVLGGAANTAANIASLGGRVSLIGLVGEDYNGKLFTDLAASLGIGFIPVLDGRPTIKKTRLLGQRQQLLRLDYEDTRPVDTEAQGRILKAFEKALPRAGVVVVSDYAKGFLTEALCQSIIRSARKSGRTVVIDPRPQHFTFYRGCDYLTPNWKEGQELLGRMPEPLTDEAVHAVGLELSARLKAKILLTLGPRGISFFDAFAREPESFNIPTAAREVFDVSGAGDTVVAVFALAKASGLSDREAIALANRAAGIVVGKLGTATVTPEELLGQEDGDGRLVARAELAPLASRLRAAGRSLVTLNGSFDLLHAGHLHILEEAKRQGDLLLVGLNGDASVRRYKGPGRPIVPEAERARMLLALRAVDYVHIFDEDAPMAFLEELKPDVHVNGSEYGANCIEADTVNKHGGRLHIVEKVPGLSTTAILHRLKGP